MSGILMNPEVVKLAYQRIKGYLHQTPIVTSETLDDALGHKIYFKVESLQKTGAFKVRGSLNHLLALKEERKLPSKVVAYSTGNHGIGLAWAAKKLGISARIYLPENTAQVKQQAAKYYGAEVIYTKTRAEAEKMTKLDGGNGFYYMHPSDSDLTIAGAGTLCYEAINQLGFAPDAIFASCGGGGLLSGTYLAKELTSPTTLLFGCEPENANDAYKSVSEGKIFRFSESPDTVADGLRTLGVSERTFQYLKKLDGIYLGNESDIYYWTAWLIHLLKIECEPSCAINMTGITQWIKTQSKPRNILVLISGGNIDPSLYREIWSGNFLAESLQSRC
ncbi:MAG: serine/threonine dehydratase [Rickettsiaceae bacterium]|nr:serine/threonine dehydratase [Rickettsiaceae bacterium]